MTKLWDRLVTGALVVSAISVAAVAVRRELRDETRPTAAARIAPPDHIDGWEDFSAIGRWIGDSTAKVRLVEFTDYECPFCRRFHEQFAAMRQEFGKDVSLLIVQYPLPNHRFARPAAYAAECAHAAGRWEQFHDALYAKQDSFGLKSWASYASDAGIKDTASFLGCVRRTSKSDRVEAGLAAGTRIRIVGTPTILIDGWRYNGTPFDSLTAIVRSKLKGTATGPAE